MRYEGVEVHVVTGTLRAIPSEISHVADLVVVDDLVVKARESPNLQYGTIVTLGPGRTDFAVVGVLSPITSLTVRTILDAWWQGQVSSSA